MSQSCPICGVAVERSDRYPDHLCRDCVERAADATGERLQFFNADLWGGYAARFVATGLPYQSHDCFVDGVPCRADEARFGGIVVQPARTTSESC